ncbi:hypothetical protein HaLaN_27076 [Haematococcus lacustris]|uniref:Uncharacterized protein n=1 Tax=Haematococcus lacustris TaxID=44745 RepID=A0A6A0A7Q3_HAELA|nr:hypothetical protein HaLaN_27076 [Haematococcus lacustris]
MLMRKVIRAARHHLLFYGLVPAPAEDPNPPGKCSAEELAALAAEASKAGIEAAPLEQRPKVLVSASAVVDPPGM